MDESIIKEVYERQFNLVYRTAFVYMRNEEDAKDAASSVFLIYIKKSMKFKDLEHERAWFITVTRNWCKDVLKSTWKKRVDLGDLPEKADDSNENSVLEEVLGLPQKYRELIYLYYYEGYSLREIARIIAIPESTCQSRIAEARRRLRIEMEG